MSLRVVQLPRMMRITSLIIITYPTIKTQQIAIMSLITYRTVLSSFATQKQPALSIQIHQLVII
jgi:hypothetical protein